MKTELLPPRTRIVHQVGDTLILQKVKSRRHKFKMTKAQRDKIAKRAREFVLPVGDLAANAIPLTNAVMGVKNLIEAPSYHKREAVVHLVDGVIGPYTGLTFTPTGSAPNTGVKVGWSFGRMGEALVPNVGLMVARKSGATRRINKALRKFHVRI